MEAFYGILIPFLGTSLGAACEFFMKKSLSDAVQRSLTGFAAGVMVAASVWSLLIPAIEQSSAMGKLSFLPAFLGFWVGILFLLLLDHVVPHLHAKSGQVEGPKSQLQRTTMMVLAVTLHNIPEGMAVGLAFALAADGESLAGAFALALGIGVQNFPEGAAVALPVYQSGKSKRRAFWTGVLSGICSSKTKPNFFCLAILFTSSWILFRRVSSWIWLIKSLIAAIGTTPFFAFFCLHVATTLDSCVSWLFRIRWNRPV